MRVLGCVVIRLDQSSTADATVRTVRHALDGLAPGSTIKLDVGRNSLPFDFSDLIPADATVQITGPDAYTVAAWCEALSGPSTNPTLIDQRSTS